MNLSFMQWISPWEFSPTLVFAFIISGWLFWRGSQVRRINKIRKSLFWIGFVLLYLALHTHVDYFAERVFYIHRLQHLFLHHLIPLMIMASYPGQVLRAGLPMGWRYRLRDFRKTTFGRGVEYLLTHKVLIPFLFVFLVIIWLFPTIQFYSMIDWQLYRFMNWSVVISGFLYWNLIIDRRPWLGPKSWHKPGRPAVMSHKERILSPVLTMLPQIIAGAYIAFTSDDLYPIFDLCGRALDVSALEDQGYGGIIMWVPAAAVETIALMVAVYNWMRLSAQGRNYARYKYALA